MYSLKSSKQLYDNTVVCFFLDLLDNSGNCLWKLACEVMMSGHCFRHMQDLIKWILLGCLTNDVFVKNVAMYFILHRLRVSQH